MNPPITTPVRFVEAVVSYLQANCPSCKIIIGEGTGSVDYDTFHCFENLGYVDLARGKDVELIDLNLESLIKLEESKCTRLPELYIPEIVHDTFLISLPVLKAHTLAKVTLSLKNMMGCVPPSHYRSGNSWGKSSFHHEIDDAIFELNRYRQPDFTLLDASVGMAQAHLWGDWCDPPVGKLVGGWDPVAVDSYGTHLLGKRWQDVAYIQMAHNSLGLAEPLEIIEI